MDLPTPCLHCHAMLHHEQTTTNGKPNLGYCDCCQRLAPFSTGQKLYSGRVCASCERGDPAILSELQEPARLMKYAQSVKQLMYTIGAINSAVARVHEGEEDSRRKQVEERFASYSATWKELRASQHADYERAQGSIELTRQLYKQQVETERGLSSAMIELGEYLLDQAGKQGLHSNKNLRNAAKALYPGGDAPEHVKVYLTKFRKGKHQPPLEASASDPSVPTEPCANCSAMLPSPTPSFSAAAFCDCCQRVVPAPSLSERVPFSEISTCTLCHATGTTTGIATKRAELGWVLEVHGRFQSLRDFVKKQLRATTDHATLAKIPTARLQSVEQEVNAMRGRRKALSAQQRAALSSDTTTSTTLRSLYADEISFCSELLAVYEDGFEVLAEANAVLGDGGAAMASIAFFRDRFEAHNGEPTDSTLNDDQIQVKEEPVHIPVPAQTETTAYRMPAVSDTRPRMSMAVPAQAAGPHTRKRSRSRSRERSPPRIAQRPRDEDYHRRSMQYAEWHATEPPFWPPSQGDSNNDHYYYWYDPNPAPHGYDYAGNYAYYGDPRYYYDGSGGWHWT